MGPRPSLDQTCDELRPGWDGPSAQRRELGAAVDIDRPMRRNRQLTRLRSRAGCCQHSCR
jgi:hypothetical protein